jgi:hypothetical protein
MRMRLRPRGARVQPGLGEWHRLTLFRGRMMRKTTTTTGLGLVEVEVARPPVRVPRAYPSFGESLPQQIKSIIPVAIRPEVCSRVRLNIGEVYMWPKSSFIWR